MAAQSPISAPDKPAVIELRGIHKAFDERVIFEDASLAIREGEMLTIIGESGSGKSIFCKMMVGLVMPDAGEVLFKGRDVTQMNAAELQQVRRQAGYVFQSDALFDSMTVLDNVGYGLREHTHMGSEAIRARAVDCLEMVGLAPEVLDRMPADLSGGMRRRVALARTVALEPEIIIYDEPMGGLDPQNITRIGRMIQGLQKRLGGTTVIVTHEIQTAFQISDRVAMLSERKIPWVASPDELRHSDITEVREFIDEALAAAAAMV